ncbi:MAG: BatA domain-containing protein [Planctomycetota bacterium]|nr:BatA domain-containing protein [Planctomycetota bacterium]
MELSFGLPMLLWALPLALAPVLLHIRARARERAVDFPGAFFMQDPAMPSAERRRQVEDLFLLILRCLLLALVVAALAGPRLKGISWLAPAPNDPTAGREAVVLVVDDSPSLAQRRTGDGVNVLERLLQGAAETLAQGRRRVGVETSSGRTLPFMDAAELPARVKELLEQPPARSGDRTVALGRAVQRLKEAVEDRAVVVLLTDPGLNAEEDAREALEARWNAALGAFREKRAPVLLYMDVNGAWARQWSVESIEPVLATIPGTAGRAPVAGQPFGLKIRVRCHAGAGTRTLRVETAPVPTETAGALGTPQVKTLIERAVSLDPGGVSDVEIPALALAPGAYWYRARLDGDDDLPFDDAAEAVVRVQPRREVVLWDLRGSGGSELADLARRSLAAALDPLSGTDQTRVRLSQPAAPRVDDLPAQGILVALHGVSSGNGSAMAALGHGPSERLSGMVQEGLNLLWVPDLTGKPESWPAPVGGRKISSDALFPRGLERVEAAATDAPGWTLGISASGHPMLLPFANGRNGDLGGVALTRRLRLGVDPAHARLAGAWENEQVLGRFADGLPAIVFQRSGAGAIGQFAFGPEPSGGIVQSTAWPILLQEFIEWAADDGLGAEPGPAVYTDSAPRRGPSARAGARAASRSTARCPSRAWLRAAARPRKSPRRAKADAGNWPCPRAATRSRSRCSPGRGSTVLRNSTCPARRRSAGCSRASPRANPGPSACPRSSVRPSSRPRPIPAAPPSRAAARALRLRKMPRR